MNVLTIAFIAMIAASAAAQNTTVAPNLLGQLNALAQTGVGICQDSLVDINATVPSVQATVDILLQSFVGVSLAMNPYATAALNALNIAPAAPLAVDCRAQVAILLANVVSIVSDLRASALAAIQSITGVLASDVQALLAQINALINSAKGMTDIDASNAAISRLTVIIGALQPQIDYPIEAIVSNYVNYFGSLIDDLNALVNALILALGKKINTAILTETNTLITVAATACNSYVSAAKIGMEGVALSMAGDFQPISSTIGTQIDDIRAWVEASPNWVPQP